jgi:hypothetical protein
MCDLKGLLACVAPDMVIGSPIAKRNQFACTEQGAEIFAVRLRTRAPKGGVTQALFSRSLPEAIRPRRGPSSSFIAFGMPVLGRTTKHPWCYCAGGERVRSVSSVRQL